MEQTKEYKNMERMEKSGKLGKLGKKKMVVNANSYNKLLKCL